MASLGDIRQRVGQAGLPLILTAMLGYFAYHAVNGERGWLAYLSLRNQTAILDGKLEEIHRQRTQMERQTALLGSRDRQYDPDLLDERARDVLGLARPDEVVILRPQP